MSTASDNDGAQNFAADEAHVSAAAQAQASAAAQPTVDTQGSAGTEELHEQIEQDRQALADTISALHSKTDVKGRVREKAADAEIAAADLAGWVGRKAGTVPRLAKQATETASEQVRDTVRDKVPEPVRSSMEQALGRRELRIAAAAVTALVAVVVVRQRRRSA
jgi:Protein of unknown function (DUF3618)